MHAKIPYKKENKRGECINKISLWTITSITEDWEHHPDVHLEQTERAPFLTVNQYHQKPISQRHGVTSDNSQTA